eukprot:XP_011670034.1 PREDICTED: histone-lysine N-methyltransferase SMYD3 [Strongylocentrotus purpuratus]
MQARVVSTLKKCSSCHCVSYCNKSCQRGDWARCHKQDCKTLKKIHPRVPSDLAQLLSQVIRKQRQSPPCTQDDGDCFPTTVDQLESHHENLSTESSLSALHKLKHCIEEEDVPTDPRSLLKMYGATNCNSFGIFDNDLIVISDAIYLRASMANHSCDYNCIVVFDERKLQLRTVKDVQEGEECTIGYVDVIHPAKERRAELEEKYHFTCKCVKCIEEINALGPDDGLGEELRDLKKSLEQIVDAENSHDWAKVIQLCEPYLKPMDSSSSLPANHQLLVMLRDTAFFACIQSQSWKKAAEMGQLNIESYIYHYGRYNPNVGMYLLKIGEVLLNLDRLREARKCFKEAESVFKVTHGLQHSLMASVKKLLFKCR